jgi:hypothetical protein
LATRSDWDKNYEERYARLAEVATSGIERKAVSDFKQEAMTAIQKQRTSIDQAVEGFTQKLNQLIAVEKTNTDTALNTLQTSFNKILTDAKTDCTNGKASSEVRRNLKLKLEQAQNFVAKNNTSAFTTINPKIQELIKTRDAVTRAAQIQFEKDILQAVTHLKTAFQTL